MALDAAKNGFVHAVATGPAPKSVFTRVRGGPFPGHTEFFHAELGTSPRPVMLFVARGMRLALHTIHVPLRQVPARVRLKSLAMTLRALCDGLQKELEIPEPSVDVLALNPHASEGGRIGREDLNEVGPAIEHAQSLGLRVHGPFPADGYFSRYAETPHPDAVLALYHDQGLGPFKLWERGRGCQTTLGLSVPRTSCDHGTAYDIAGQGVARAHSMSAALALAARLARRRTGRLLR
jgi:4-hydroxythreonine-4-phosphate dehydrogenase